MRKIVFINETCGTGSHGKICLSLAKEFEERGFEAKIAHGRLDYVPNEAKPYAIRIGNSFSVRCHALLTRVFDRHGFGSYFATRRFLNWLESYSPNVIWLHNLHGYYINIKLLFNWLKQHPKINVKWTLHDCWAFTGHCSHFMAVGCEKWKECCKSCPEKHSYPKSLFVDSSKKNYLQKKKIFTSLPNIDIVTPCKWLADRVKESFLSKYSVDVVYNKIDTTIFRKRKTTLKKALGINDKQMILAVASKWTKRKGFEDLLLFSQIIHKNYVLVVVGTSKKQASLFPKETICIERTENQINLAEFYSASDWFINFTYEDTYPTVNLEAEACGSRVITYNSGGSGETIHGDNSFVIKTGDYQKALEIIEEKSSL